MKAQNTQLGIILMVAVTFVFAMQDGISRHLAGAYNVMMVVMIRYWFFAAFAIWLGWRKAGSLRAAGATHHPILQPLRGVLLAVQINVLVLGFVKIGLVGNHAIFASYPLMIAALSGPILGESVGWRRWVAIGIGFVGVLIILQPGFAVFSPYALLPIVGAVMFATYGLLTRYVGRKDRAVVSFFWVGTVGAAITTIAGVAWWEPMIASDWAWMLLLCVTGIVGHYMLISAYEVAEASAIQPFAYLQLVFASILGMTVFQEVLELHVAIGAGVVVLAGLFTLWRARQVRH
ncbi:DMT family transporter [Pseudorhodobacter sp. W20_MBD10_FR17]|uniref:DMT family transporter n=1 Tax=Pseudorhodobacter sp. W20_MBD10_FR17 TaxID=3240266 RepID=UPI003F9BC8BF